MSKIRLAEIPVLIQAAIIGFTLSEVWFLGRAVGHRLSDYLLTNLSLVGVLISCVLSLVVCISYFLMRSGHNDFFRIVKSRRMDILILATLGSLIPISASGVGIKFYQEWMGKLSEFQLLVLTGIPVAIALTQILRSHQFRKREGPIVPFFLSDKEIEGKDGDLLASNLHAERFAERVLNGGASESVVFGIDAPWGSGKSSFVNFCCEYWKNRADPKVIVHRFEPLRYEQSSNLAERFIEDLIATIERSVYAPSIRPLFSKYSKIVKGASDFTLFGLKFEPSLTTVEDTLENLEDLLKTLGVRIIVVVDDLDRVGWDAVKTILFAVKRSFMLSNISYVLCYDTENIVSESEGHSKVDVRDFLEKFVNVKFSLYLDSHMLADYVSKNFEIAVRNNLGMDPQSLSAIKKTLDVLIGIYNSPNFLYYQEILADVRKIKRLINTLLLLEIDKTDFENNDFNKSDLIHLLLLYVGYPSVFRKIYAGETNGRSGFFSLCRNRENDEYKYQNSKYYSDYCATLSVAPQFILRNIFDPAFVIEDDFHHIDEFVLRTRACFNLEHRNLEKYLRLIVNLSKPDKRESYSFYLNWKNSLVAGTSIESIMNDESVFSEASSRSREELWRVIADSAPEYSSAIAANLIRYLLDHIPTYSMVEKSAVFLSSRNRANYALLKILDASQWNDSIRRLENSSNLNPIADWIFGEGQRSDSGIIDKLTSAERGVLGFYDVLIFRLYCSADYSGSFYNIRNSLSRHIGASAPTQGVVSAIAIAGMREISQSVFSVFNQRYISASRNFFDEVNSLSPTQLTGGADALMTDESLAELIESKVIEKERSHIKSFVLYQLANTMPGTGSGVGCGFYDEVGSENAGGIAQKMNDYLFRFCFNPQLNQGNFEHFLDYVMSNFELGFGFGVGHEYVPGRSELAKVLDLSEIALYWNTYQEKIRSLRFEDKDKRIYTSAYVVNYNTHLPAVFKMLDEVVESRPRTERESWTQ